uniref:Protein transport protein sec16 n=1 Tax=Trichuris muris TaxID=70415 RepID=A0A5S6R5H5_TRIMR
MEEVAVPPFRYPPPHTASQPYPQYPESAPVSQEHVLPEGRREPEFDWSQILNDAQSNSHRHEPTDPVAPESSVATVGSQTSGEAFLPSGSYNRALVNRGQGKPCYVRVTPWPNADLVPSAPQQVLERTSATVPTGLATPIVSPALEIDPVAPSLEISMGYNANGTEQRQISHAHTENVDVNEVHADFGVAVDMQVRSSCSPSNLPYPPSSRSDFVSSTFVGDGNDGAFSLPSAENFGVEPREVRRTIVNPLPNPVVSAENNPDGRFATAIPLPQLLETNSGQLNRASDSDAASQTGHSSVSDVRREPKVRQELATSSKRRTSALHKRFLEAAARTSFVSRRNVNSEEAPAVEAEPPRVVSLIPNEVDVVAVKLMPTKGDSGRTPSSGSCQTHQNLSTGEIRRTPRGRSLRANIPDAEPDNYSSSDRDTKARQEKQHRFKRNVVSYGEHWEGESGHRQRSNDANRYRYSDEDEEGEEEVRENEREFYYQRPKSRGSTRSAYEARDEYDEYRHPAYGTKGNRMVRSLSRMSDQDDWKSEEYGRSYKPRYRPKSAQLEHWEDRNDSDEANYDEEARRLRRHGRKVHSSENVLSDPRMRALWQIPAWRHYLNEHRRQCGYFPTYEQLEYYTLAQQQPAMVPNVAHAAVAHTAPATQFSRPPNGAVFPGSLLAPTFAKANLTAAQVQPKLPAEPYLHTRPHATCCFGSGGHLITYGQPKGVKGLCTAVEIRNFRSYLLDEKLQADIALIEAFPGPLDAERTAKDAVLHYCTKRLEQLQSSYEHRDHHNMLLMFQFFILMVRQNGIVSGKDLAHMLLETCDDGCDYGEKSTFEDEGQGDVVSDSDNDFVIPLREETNGSGRSVASKSVQTTDMAEQQYTRLLLRGYLKEAMDFAIKTKLWGHALFLAMKMNKHMHTTVMTRFANSVPMDSPLQTLYQMLSGGVPYASTRLPDKSWIEWRPHLAVILANLTSQDEEMRQRELYGVLTMGHTLFNCGQIFGSQFCYICCHLLANWNIFESGQGQQSPLVSLVGVDSAETEDFAIQNYILTEVLEYTIALHWLHTSNCLFWILPFQSCKLQFTTRMAELGYREEAISYCKVLNKALRYQWALGTTPSLSFCSSVYELASKYQRFDPDSELPIGSIGVPEWLHSLGALCDQLKNGGSCAAPAPANVVEAVSPDMPTPVFTRSDVSNVSNANASTSFEGEPLVVKSEYGHPAAAAQTGSPARLSHAMHVSTTSSADPSLLGQRGPGSNDSRVPEPAGVVRTVKTTVATEIRSQIQESFSGVTSGSQPSVSATLPVEAPAGCDASAPHYTLLSWEASQRRRSEELHWASGPNAAGSAVQPSSNGNVETENGRKAVASKKEQQSWIGKTMGGFINKLIPKGPNEMILPDDSQKTIVWDKERERWIDVTAGDGDSAEQVAPPPSASSAVPSPVAQPDLNDHPCAAPAYSGVKAKRYVDVVKSAAAPSDSSSSSILPPQPFSVGETVAAPQTYWIPQSHSTEADVVSPFTEAAPHEDAQQSSGVPFMDPSRYATG